MEPRRLQDILDEADDFDDYSPLLPTGVEPDSDDDPGDPGGEDEYSATLRLCRIGRGVCAWDGLIRAFLSEARRFPGVLAR